MMRTFKIGKHYEMKTSLCGCHDNEAKGSKGKEVQLKVWIWNESSCNKNGKEKTGLRMVWQLQSVWRGDRLCWEANEGGTSDFQITGFGTWGSFIKSSSKSLYIIHCEIRDALANQPSHTPVLPSHRKLWDLAGGGVHTYGKQPLS